ncbi:MAG: DUF4351 domain-containing protein [Polyangiaceae bacterium]|nr:DUF4351 domain-containing protein [Polyangiaceae bacterium]
MTDWFAACLAKPQRFLPFRQLRYLVRLWDKWLQEHPNATHLPIVIPRTPPREHWVGSRTTRRAWAASRAMPARSITSELLVEILKMEDKNIMPSIAEHLIAKGEKFGIEKGRKEGIKLGREEGLAQGRRTTLLHLIRRKFGSVPPQLATRVEQASSAELETWLDRILTANTLSEIFDG